MILSYSKPSFKADILAGIKKHTLREDIHNRWKPGMKIHHWMHNPRNVKKNPHEFMINHCTSIQEVIIKREIVPYSSHACLGSMQIIVDGTPIENWMELINNDGLTYTEFQDWFVPLNEFPDKTVKAEWIGKIIHWTDLKY